MTTREAVNPEFESRATDDCGHGSELERCRAELAIARRELESFTYSVAHDLRAPVRSIIGFNQALAEDCAGTLDETAQNYLERISENAQCLEQMIDGLLQLSRISRSDLHPQPVDLSEIVRATATQLLEQEPQRGVEFLIPLGVQAHGDATLLRRALEHLLGNAWKFTAQQAQACIEFGTRPDEAGKPIYFVRDNGVGFDQKYSDRLFGVFQRLHSPSQFTGTGIGLALLRCIINRHRGEVWIEGAVGQGATVYFTLNS